MRVEIGNFIKIIRIGTQPTVFQMIPLNLREEKYER